jgi:hypothetical protein
MSSTKPFGIYARIGPEAFHMLQAPELLSVKKVGKRFLGFELKTLLVLNSEIERDNTGK